jgi:hypothetical protein
MGRRTPRALAATARVLPIAAVVAGCASQPRTLPEWTPIPVPDPQSVDVAVFLIGDAGEALPGESPVLAHLSAEMETWTQALGRDSAVAVVYLGDNIYPNGLHEADDPSFPLDSARLQAQIDVVAGEIARQYAARAIFVAGNHDWGQIITAEGIQNLENQQEFIERARERDGLAVFQYPPAGVPGPVVVDMGATARLILLDTVWWLFMREEDALDVVFENIGEALSTEGAREAIVAGHHPLHTAGPHGGLTPFWRSLGVMFLLRRTGSLLQDLNSGPYRQLADDLRQAFEEAGPPLVMAGGHEHSLQVFGKVMEHDPQFSLVSGSGSKLEDVGWAEGLEFRAAEPGYMKILFLKDGSVDLFVHSAPAEHQRCVDPSGEPLPVDPLAACIRDGVDAFRTIYSARLKGPGGPPDQPDPLN